MANRGDKVKKELFQNYYNRLNTIRRKFGLTDLQFSDLTNTIILNYHLNDYVDGMYNTFSSRDDILVYPNNINYVTRGQKLESNIDSNYNQILTDWENTCDGDYGGDYGCDGYCPEDYPYDYGCDIECPEDYLWGGGYFPYGSYDAGPCDGEWECGEWPCSDYPDYK